MCCFDVQELEAFLEQTPPNSRHDTAIGKHVETCAQCRALAVEVAENMRVAGSMAGLGIGGQAWEADESSLPKAVGKYRIRREIGRGGMGVVYEAEAPDSSEAVALKVLGRGSADERRVRLFRREARALARLKHPSVATIREAGRTVDGQHYLVMDLACGVPLHRYLQERDLSRRKRLELFCRICRAINDAHLGGVIHLDIKPSNILIDAEGRPKVLDFGLARIVEGDVSSTIILTETERLQGTLPYMSPERFGEDSDQVDARADVYSLAVILYQVLTDALPFDVNRARPHEAVRRINEEPPPRPSSIDRTLRGDLETIVLKGLEKQPAHRYQSALAIAEDIERYLAHQPILARPASSFYQLRKLASRHKLPFGIAAGMVLLLAGFGISMSTLYARAQQARRDLEVVAEFQANMLGTVDAQQFGHNVLTELRNSVEKVLEDAEMPQAEIDGVLTALDEPLGWVNRADFGSELLHENILSRASVALSQDFADRPLMEARLRSTIGGVYQRLGDYDRAEPHLRAAWEIRNRELGERHTDALESAQNLATLYIAQGRYEDAGPLILETLESRRHALGRDHPDTLESMSELAGLYKKQGRYDEAESLFVETLETSRRVLGEEHHDTLCYVNNLAFLYELQGRYDEVEPLYAQAVDGLSRTLGPDHSETLTIRANLARLFYRQGRFEEAEPRYVEVLALQRKVLGGEHPFTLVTTNNLASLYKELGRYDEAERLYVKILEMTRRMFGNDHPRTLGAMSNLGVMYQAQGRTDEALPLKVEALETRRRVLGDKHPSTLRSVSGVASLHYALGEYDKAERLYIEALEGMRLVLGDGHPSTLTTINNLAVLHVAQDRYDDAEAVLSEGLKASRRALGEEHPSTLTLLSALTGLYRTQGRYKEAEPFAAAAAAAARAALPDDHWRKGDCLRLHGWLLMKLERFEEAEELLLEARRASEIALGPTHKQPVQAIRCLVELYDVWGKPEKAAEFRALLPPDAVPQGSTADRPASTEMPKGESTTSPS